MIPSLCIADFGPVAVLRPASVADLCDHVRSLAQNNQAIYPVGGQTMLGFGLPPAKAGSALDLTALQQVIDYPARDMTITVQAGVRMAELHQILAAEGQRLPIDIPRAAEATLGGSIACNTSGPRRLGFGTFRDYVIGITTINDQGQETKAGGRVVKNVAGYDFCKLHTGALGTLGVISQVTLKVRPAPEEQALLAMGCPSDKLEAMLDLLHTSHTRPMCLEVLNRVAVKHISQRKAVHLPEADWVLVVGYEDSEAAVGWQIQQLIKEVTSSGIPGNWNVEAVAGAASLPLWEALTEAICPPEFALGLRASVLPSRAAEFCRFALALGEPMIQSHAANGVVRLHWPEAANAQEVFQSLSRCLKTLGGHLVTTRCPSPLSRQLSAAAGTTANGQVQLMREIKRKLDPADLFNPGRYLPPS